MPKVKSVLFTDVLTDNFRKSFVRQAIIQSNEVQAITIRRKYKYTKTATRQTRVAVRCSNKSLFGNG